MANRIPTVTSLRARLLRGTTPTLVITAQGTSPNGGHHSPQLRALPGSPGVCELEFLAEERSPATGASTSLGASFTLCPIPAGLRKVIVHALHGTLELSWLDEELRRQITAAAAPVKLPFARGTSQASLEDAILKAATALKESAGGELADYFNVKATEIGMEGGTVLGTRGKKLYAIVHDIAMPVFKFTEVSIPTGL